jgi:hypothetical protein
MDVNNLKRKWETLIQTDTLKGYKSATMSSACSAEIYLGVNTQKNHCMILVLPKSYKLDFNAIKKEKISITFYAQTGYLVIELRDNRYYDIFDDLILSLFQAIKDITEVEDYTHKIIYMFNEWSEFFEDESSNSLSGESIKGLFGELYILETMIQNSSASTVNEVLESWRGPYDGPYDFVLDQKNIEVKTKSLAKQTVNISSEYQLESQKGKTLELLVLSVREDVLNGLSLRELLEKIKKLTFAKSGNYFIVLKALQQKNINPQNIVQYDNYRFVAIEQTVYDGDSQNFPKLVKSNTAEAISNIKYTLQLSYINKFILSTKKYND